MVAVTLPNALTHCKCSQFSPHFLTAANLPMREQELLAHPQSSLSHRFNKDSLYTRTLFIAYATIKQACFTRNGKRTPHIPFCTFFNAYCLFEEININTDRQRHGREACCYFLIVESFCHKLYSIILDIFV